MFRYEGCCKKGRYEIKSGPPIEIEGTKRNDLPNIPVALYDSSREYEQMFIPGDPKELVVEDDDNYMHMTTFDSGRMIIFSKIQFTIVVLLIMVLIALVVKKVNKKYTLRKK